MQHEITIPLCYLQAVRLFTSKNDIRYYLKGVAIREGTAAGTDGTYVGVITLYGVDPTLPEVIIPNEAIDFYVKKAGRSTLKDVTIRWDSEKGNGSLANGAGDVEIFKAIEGRYPDVARVIPENAPPTGNPQFEWSRLVQFEKAAIALGVAKGAALKAHLSPNGDAGSARVTIPGHPEFVGVVSPLRAEYVNKTMAGA